MSSVHLPGPPCLPPAVHPKGMAVRGVAGWTRRCTAKGQRAAVTVFQRSNGVFKGSGSVPGHGFGRFCPHFGWFEVDSGHICRILAGLHRDYMVLLRILAGTLAPAQGPDPAYPPRWSKKHHIIPMLHRQNGANLARIDLCTCRNGGKIGQTVPCDRPYPMKTPLLR